MGEALPSMKVPLLAGADGVIRVQGTRVTLDTILSAFGEGATAEEIVQQYPSLALADVYQVIAYSLQHSADVNAYLAERQRLAGAMRESNEAAWSPLGIRERLLSRRKS